VNILRSILPLAVAAAAGTEYVIAQPGQLGKSRIAELMEAPDHLARMDRADRELWLEQSCARVAQTAQSEGFLDASCQASAGRIDSLEDRAVVRVDYSQGPIYRVGKVELSFIDHPTGAVPHPASLPVRTGEKFEQTQIVYMLQEVQQFYRRAGWLDASVVQNLSIARDSQRVDLRLDVDLGRLAIFSGMEIRFFGQHLTPSSRIAELWTLRPGDTIRNQDIAWFQRKIAQTRLFNQVRLDRVPARADTQRTDLRLDLTERIPGSLEFALSWEPMFGWGLGGTVRHQNVEGTFNALSLDARMAEHQQRARLGAGTPLLWGTPISLDLGLGIVQQRAQLPDSTLLRQITLSTDGTFSYQPTDWSTISLGLETERLTKYPMTGGNRVEYMFQTQLGGALDFRDEPFDPMEGWILRPTLGWGVQFGNDTSYVWTQAEGRYYLPLFWRFSSAFAVEGGYFFNNTTLDGSTVLWTGGPGTVRSYSYQELRFSPPPGYGYRPRMLRSSGELRMSLPWSTQIVGFLDVARLWNLGEHPDYFDASTAKIGYGVGLRKRISLLSLRLDFCFGRGSEVFAFDLAQAI